MLEVSNDGINLRLFNHKKHLIVLTMYGFLANTLNMPYYWVTFILIAISMIRDGIKHGGRQIKKTDPNYLQVIQPIFLGIMISVYIVISIRIYQGALKDTGLGDIPDIVLYFFIFFAVCMDLIFFPLIVSAMITFTFYVPYYVGYKFGKLYHYKSRVSKPDEMIDFLSRYKIENVQNDLRITERFE